MMKLARWFVIVFGGLIMFFGAFILAEPQNLAQGAESFLTEGGWGFAVGLRLTFGVLLWLLASASRTPRTMRVLAVLSLLGALFLLVVGLDGMLEIAAWGTSLDNGVLRVVGLFAFAMGAFIIWTLWPRRSNA